MSMKSDALWTMSRRYQKAAEAEKDLVEAEKLTAKCIDYYNAWRENNDQNYTWAILGYTWGWSNRRAG